MNTATLLMITSIMGTIIMGTIIMITRLTSKITMPTDPRLLTIAQWVSPAFPMGSYAFSHGLESAIAEGWVQNEESLYEWLSGIISQGSGLSDAAFFWAAFRAEDIALLDAEARAFTSASERLREAERQGAAFARVVRDVWGFTLPDLLLPVALGHAAALAELPAEETCALYLHSFASNLTQAAQRLMPLGQTGGQRVLHRLTPLCQATANKAKQLRPEEIYSNALLSDIAAMRHETLEPRLFQS